MPCDSHPRHIKDLETEEASKDVLVYLAQFNATYKLLSWILLTSPTTMCSVCMLFTIHPHSRHISYPSLASQTVLQSQGKVAQ